MTIQAFSQLKRGDLININGYPIAAWRVVAEWTGLSIGVVPIQIRASSETARLFADVADRYERVIYHDPKTWNTMGGARVTYISLDDRPRGWQ